MDKAHRSRPAASARLYEPSHHAWSPPGSSKHVGRPQGHTATLLANGKVLVAGGGRARRRARRSTTRRNTVVAARQPGRPPATHHTATLLPNGKVLVAGGTNGGSASPARSSTTRPPSTWAPPAASRPRAPGTPPRCCRTARCSSRAEQACGSVASAELYDPATGTWSSGREHGARPRTSHTATLLPNGKVLVAGRHGAAALASAELYDPATGTGAPTGSSAPTARYVTRRRCCRTARCWSPAARTAAARSPARSSTTRPPAPGAPTGSLHRALRPHRDAAAERQGAGRGGTAAPASPSRARSCTTRRPAPGAPTGSHGRARAVHTATLLPNGKVLVAGGDRNGGHARQRRAVRPGHRHLDAPPARMAAARYATRRRCCPNGKVLVAGGIGAAASRQRGAVRPGRQHLERRRLPGDRAPRPHGDAAAQRQGARRGRHGRQRRPRQRGAVRPGHEHLVGGGQHGDRPHPLTPRRCCRTARCWWRRLQRHGHLASAELYDPAANTWSPAAQHAPAARRHTATLLPERQGARRRRR